MKLEVESKAGGASIEDKRKERWRRKKEGMEAAGYLNFCFDEP